MMNDIFIYFLIGLGFMCLYRVITGPTLADRIVAIDIFRDTFLSDSVQLLPSGREDPLLLISGLPGLSLVSSAH